MRNAAWFGSDQIDDGTAVDVTASPAADGRLHVAIGDQKHTVTVVYHANSVHIFAEGNATSTSTPVHRSPQRFSARLTSCVCGCSGWLVAVPYARFKLPMVDFAAAGGMGNATVVTPMPGKVIQMNVEAGQTVEEGDALLIIEAMKMEVCVVCVCVCVPAVQAMSTTAWSSPTLLCLAAACHSCATRWDPGERQL